MKTKANVARTVLEGLRALEREPAPASLAPTVMMRCGLGDRYALLDTPLGPVYAAQSEIGVSLVMKAPDDDAFEHLFMAETGRRAYKVSRDDLPPSIVAAVEGQGPMASDDARDTPVDLRRLGPFARAVLEKTRQIPRGEVRPYAWVAAAIGRPGAVRAVGTALARNPVPLLIPCHRVVRSDNLIGAYSLGGREAKQRVLEYEGVDVAGLERLGRAGVRYVASGADGRSFCLPTCGAVGRIEIGERETFRTVRQAYAAGLRPCADCMPTMEEAG